MKRPDKQGSRRRALAVPRAKLLTLEEEQHLSRTIEQAETRILEACAGSLVALRELEQMCTELAERVLRPEELFRLVPEGRCAERVQQEVLDALRDAQGNRTRRAARRQSASERLERLEVARARFVTKLLRYRLSHKAVTRILQRLRTARSVLHGSRRASLELTARVIARNSHKGEVARQQMVEANVGLVLWVAGRLPERGLSKNDLVQEGSLGLLRAIEKYDHRRGIRFNTYAIWWIRAFMHRAFSDKSRGIRVPVHMVEKRSRLQRQITAWRSWPR